MNEQPKFTKGEDIVFTFDGKSALHATDHTLNVDLEIKDVRTKHTNGKNKIAGDMNWSVDVNGLVATDPSITGAVDSDGILDFLRKKGEVDCIFKSPIAGVMKTYTGKVLFTKFTQSSQAGENATYQATATGSGDFEPVESGI